MAQINITNGIAFGTWRAALNTMFGELYVGQTYHPGYVAGRYYQPLPSITVANGSTLTADAIRFHPVMIHEAITISELGARMSTAAASQNVQFAIYGSHATTHKPTGAALGSTGNVSTDVAAGPISGALSVNAALDAGLYYFAINSSSSTPVFTVSASSNTTISSMLGSATLLNIMSAATTALMIYSLTSKTFNTWPDVTAETFSETSTTSSWALISFKVESIP